MGRSSSPVDNHHDSTTTRSTSPLHFLNPSAVAHLAHHHHHPHRASAEGDLSRILDPSYLPSSSRAAHVSPTAVTAYVDPHGDLHDPDYRHFPVYAPHQHANQQSPKRRGNSPRRPHFDWEVELDEHALDDEYEEEGSFSKHNFTAPRYPTTPSSSRSWSSSGQSQAMRPRESSFSTTLSMPMSKYSPAYYSPTGTASTLPTSYEDDAHDLKADSPVIMISLSSSAVKVYPRLSSCIFKVLSLRIASHPLCTFILKHIKSQAQVVPRTDRTGLDCINITFSFHLALFSILPSLQVIFLPSHTHLSSFPFPRLNASRAPHLHVIAISHLSILLLDALHSSLFIAIPLMHHSLGQTRIDLFVFFLFHRDPGFRYAAFTLLILVLIFVFVIVAFSLLFAFALHLFFLFFFSLSLFLLFI
ncbi:hypothetical protein CPB84DRAFT_764461 [Gymnopilus junonius]|uniref:Uncharacterized protein n=1 Tax=Gymnopilus junonius TaxID=109634 RepID=A0A9P5P1P7_GYMJU|nr:hypothetical protein CPB84DRAFT_764461 [Gymnopilus junonius]